MPDTTINIGGNTVSRYVAYALAVLALVLAGWITYLYLKTPDYAGKVDIAIPAKELAGLPKLTVPVKEVQVYAAPAKKKLSLPKAVIDNDKQQVIASSKIKPSDNPHTVTTVLNTDTGASETYVRTDPLPWLAYTSSGGIGAYYGFKNGEQAIRIQARQDFIQVKAIRFSVIGSVDRMSSGQTDSFIGVGGEYRW
jgi:hypothetical protein